MKEQNNRIVRKEKYNIAGLKVLMTTYYEETYKRAKKYIAKDEKTKKFAFLSSKFSTKTEYKEIFKILDTEINEYLYIGIVAEEERTDILTKIDKINIKELSEKEYNKIINLLPKN